ncbi:binding-protein-dependent transport system inner membrane component [Tumebacillus sp. BK434]|uniref:ABC transporter permease subunit n=1 Tax=Tumebacillus sp. BK434 TaxID=2512169 RepID=UPI0010461517|nr:ABC transporter permease subunit [Tumebacillus sp. BK434]TCP55865.1 binding-protein-dependent transport system inner membrane component [Tumebacillus sp. BK434]
MLGILLLGNLDKIYVKEAPERIYVTVQPNRDLETVMKQYEDTAVLNRATGLVEVPYGQTQEFMRILKKDPQILRIGPMPIPPKIDVKNLVVEVRDQIVGYTEGEFGTITYRNRPDRQLPIDPQLKKMVERSFSYLIPALLTSIVAGFLLALLAIWLPRAGRVLDRINRLLLAMPDFLVVALMQMIAILLAMALRKKVLTIMQFADDTPFLIPFLAITLLPTALMYGAFRIAVTREWEEGYIKTAYAKGMSRPHVIIWHIMRNVTEDLLTVLPRVVSVAITSLVVAEVMCGVFGLGGYAINPDLHKVTSLPATCAILACFGLLTHVLVAVLRRFLVVKTKEVA